jgi:hypothetical protein
MSQRSKSEATRPADESAERFRENLEALQQPPTDEFGAFERLTDKLLRVSKAELDEKRRKA